jgi:pimeloyl-ACP methyl ester carboxylesterase
MRQVQPNADYDHLTIVGHSAGADISMYFAKLHPEVVKKLVTLDNLRVPFITSGKFKILSFRSKDPVFKTDPGVIPSEDVCEKEGIKIVRTNFQHNDMRDTGAENAKESIQSMLDQFLADTDSNDSATTPVQTSANALPKISDPGPVAPYVPAGNEAKAANALTH